MLQLSRFTILFNRNKGVEIYQSSGLMERMKFNVNAYMTQQKKMMVIAYWSTGCGLAG